VVTQLLRVKVEFDRPDQLIEVLGTVGRRNCGARNVQDGTGVYFEVKLIITRNLNQELDFSVCFFLCLFHCLCNLKDNEPNL